jgi:hypothetical protein
MNVWMFGWEIQGPGWAISHREIYCSRMAFVINMAQALETIFGSPLSNQMRDQSEKVGLIDCWNLEGLDKSHPRIDLTIQEFHACNCAMLHHVHTPEC